MTAAAQTDEPVEVFESRARARRAVAQAFAAFAPPRELTVSQWADEHRRLSRASSAEPGRWRTDRAPYQREIMDAIGRSGEQVIHYRDGDELAQRTIPSVTEIVVMSSAQVGKTEILNNAIGYFVDQDPSPILVLQPTLEMGQAYSKDRLTPMIAESPQLAQYFEGKSRHSGDTILHKVFPGGHITIAGSNSPASLASRPIRILLADETDRAPASAGAEGNPLRLAAKRTATFWNARRVYVSTPTIAGISHIESMFESSTRERWSLPCPSCGHHQSIEWSRIRFEDVTHSCIDCGASDVRARWLSGSGIWIAENPDADRRGFHLSQLVSPWVPWEETIQDFIDAKRAGPESLRVFVNTALGQVWEDEAGQEADPEILFHRREHYRTTIPAGVCVLVASVDVQGDRLEALLTGYGVGEESWQIELAIWRGDPARGEVWAELDRWLLRRFEHPSGASLSIACTTIDSGGHHSQQVYKFCKTREARRVYAIKGKSSTGAPFVARPTKSNLGRVLLFSLNVDAGKELVFSRLRISERGPGFIHIPIGDSFDLEFCQQLCSEKPVRQWRAGRSSIVWKKIRPRNEALDLAVYSLAALTILRPNLEAISRQLQTDPEDEAQQPTAETGSDRGSSPEEKAQQARRARKTTARPRRRSFVRVE